MIYSVRDSVETYVVAGNMLGKDYTAGLICLTFFLAPQCYFPLKYVRAVEANREGRPDWIGHARRVVNTSVRSDHLDVLWAEIGGFMRTSEIPLTHLTILHHEIRFAAEGTAKNPMSYLKGQTSAKGEGMAGHHAPYTLGVGDEASGLDDEVDKQFQGWAKRRLYFGNPNPCGNFFKVNYGKGDLLAA